MQSVDLNLLVVLDALLQEGSVTGAARRLHLSPPAVSRSLGKLRAIVGDPLLVRAGRNLVPTPAADRLRARTHDVVAAVYEVLTPAQTLSDMALEENLDRVFTVRCGPDNAAGFGPALLAEMRGRAASAGLHLMGDGDGSIEALRDGDVDLHLGSPISGGNETVHRETLLVDDVVIVGRADGALARACADRAPDLAELARHAHVNRVPESVWHAVLDRRLADDGLGRTVVATAPGFAAAFAMVRGSDLICLAPKRLVGPMLGADLRTWPAPIPLPALKIEQTWHHRSHTDPEHQWLRARVRSAVSASAGEPR